MTESENEIDRPTTGRTFRDIVYEGRYRLAGIVLTIAMWYFGILEDVRNALGYLVIIPIAIGIGVGIVIGYFKAELVYDYVIRILDWPNVIVYRARRDDIVPLAEGVPYVSTTGTRLRIAEDVVVYGKVLVFVPHELHRIAIVDPLTAYVHVRAIDKLVDELDKALESLTKTYVSTKTKARYLARKWLNEVLRFEDELVQRIRDSLTEDENEKRSRFYEFVCPKSLFVL